MHGLMRSERCSASDYSQIIINVAKSAKTEEGIIVKDAAKKKEKAPDPNSNSVAESCFYYFIAFN